MTRPPAGGHTSDAGFSLLEVMVAIALLGTIMTALTSFLVTVLTSTNRQSATQTAVQVADDGTERIRALKGSALAIGRDQASVDVQWSAAGAAVTPYLVNTEKAYDAGAAAGEGATAPLPTAPQVCGVGYDPDCHPALNGLPYSVNWYVGRCWQLKAGGDCVVPAVKTNYIEYFRVVVAVKWDDGHCTASKCTYVTSTLVSSAAKEPQFKIGP